MENILQRYVRIDRANECIFMAFEGTILKIYRVGANHDGDFVDSMYVPVCPKKTLDTSLVQAKFLFKAPL